MNILNHKQLNLIWIYSLALILVSPSFAQTDSRVHVMKICGYNWTGGKDASACNSNSIEGKFISNFSDEIEVNLVAHAVNIPRASDNDFISFPEEYPAPHLRYEYSPGEYKYTEELVNWSVVDEVIANDGKIHLLYRSVQTVRVLLSEDLKCDPESSAINFSIDSRLSTYSGKNQNWEDYPIYNFASESDIFSCTVFNDTKHVCDPKLKPTDLETTIDICVLCNKKGDEDNFKHSQTPIKVLSNPFSETLNFYYKSENTTDINVSLYSMDGNTILSQPKSVKKGINNIQISTENVTRATYFLSVTDGKENFVQKIICLK